MKSSRALRLLILNGDLPVFPGRAGHEYLHTTRLARLAERVGLVSLVHTHEQAAKIRSLSDAGISLYAWESPHLVDRTSPGAAARPLVRRLGKTLVQWLRTTWRRPGETLVQDYQFRNLAGPLSRAMAESDWQAVIVVQSNCAHWVDYLPPVPVTVLVLHDIRALVMERQARSARSFRRRLALWFEAWRYYQWEREYCRKYDLVITLSGDDEVWVRRHYDPKRLVTVPVPVDAGYFFPLPGVREARARIMFTGMMDHPPNVDAACYFACEVLPRIQAQIPEAEFWVVGRDPVSKVRALAGRPGVVITGTVPDIRPYLAQATVVVVPLRFGSGVRNKILEAWAMQKQVISTTLGAEGLDYRDGENILIADDAQQMAEKTIGLLNDDGPKERKLTRRREVVLKRHDPDRLAGDYYEAVAAVVREKHRQRGPMRVIVDLHWMRPGLAGGIENLSRSFLNELKRTDPYNAYVILAPCDVKYDFGLRDGSNIHLVPVDGPGQDGRKLVRKARALWHRCLRINDWRSPEVETLRRVNSLGAEVVLSPSGYIHPDFQVLSNVLVAVDLQHEYHPEFFTPSVLEERRRVYGESIRRADSIIAISEHTRQTVLDCFQIDPERVETVHLAAHPLFQPEHRRDLNLEYVLRKYGLPHGGYLFFPGHTWPHKNHGVMLKALNVLRHTWNVRPWLVCTGNAREAQPDLLRMIQDFHMEDQIRFLGYCPLSDMPALYLGAAALVYPSLFEGFGIPLVEAMWCECPVVCSNTTSLPEVTGDAALLVDPRSPEAIADAVYRVLTQADLRRTLVERGRHRARRFSWDKFTRETIRILHGVYESRYG